MKAQSFQSSPLARSGTMTSKVGGKFKKAMSKLKSMGAVSNVSGSSGTRGAGGPEVQGFKQNDFLLAKIMGSFVFMNVDFFVQDVIGARKRKEALEVIDFATDTI